MSKISRVVLGLLAVPVMAFSFSQAKIWPHFNEAKSAEVGKPYIVDVIDTSGRTTGSFSGVSKSPHPYDIALELGAAPYPEDHFLAFPDIDMGIGSKITLYRAPVYTVIDGKRKKTVRSWQKTVGELLSEQKIELGVDDKINFSTDTEIENGMQIIIVRVAVTTVIEKEAIKYQTVRKEDKTLDEGKTRVEQAGVNGEKALYYLVRREDGIEVSRTLIKTETALTPVTEKLIIGTKPVITVKCKYNDWVLDASVKNGVKPNDICNLMMKESNGNYNSVNPNGHYGLFQYDPGFWSSVSAKAGWAGADIFDAKAQIYVTAWAWAHGYQGRW